MYPQSGSVSSGQAVNGGIGTAVAIGDGVDSDTGVEGRAEVLVVGFEVGTGVEDVSDMVTAELEVSTGVEDVSDMVTAELEVSTGVEDVSDMVTAELEVGTGVEGVVDMPQDTDKVRMRHDEAVGVALIFEVATAVEDISGFESDSEDMVGDNPVRG